MRGEKDRLLTLLNRALRPAGVIVVPRPPSSKMLHEHANVSESFHPSRGGRTVVWMRRVADVMGGPRHGS